MLKGLKRLVKIIKVKRKTPNVIFCKKANIGQHSVLEGQNKIGEDSWFEGYMGFGSYIGEDCTVKAKVGRFCSIGHKVTVLTGTHPSRKFVSTNPVFYSLELQNGTTFVDKQKFKEKIFADEEHQYGAVIGNDVWIGYNATIIGGVTIGDGAIVASGALVNSNVEPYTIVAGQPARVIRKRFTDEQIDWLLKFKWWDKPLNWIKENANDFDDIEQFIKTYSNMERDEWS